MTATTLFPWLLAACAWWLGWTRRRNSIALHKLRADRAERQLAVYRQSRRPARLTAAEQAVVDQLEAAFAEPSGSDR